MQEMDTVMQVPGWSNIWTQPIANRIDMLSTGVRTQIGVKVFGPDLQDHQRGLQGNRAGPQTDSTAPRT